MSITLLHLSDIHFKIGTKNILIERVDKVASAVTSVAKASDSLFIVVTGDIAYSGMPDEYQVAKEFFGDLINNISSHFSEKVTLLFIPGNHDCNFSTPNKAREILISSLTDYELDDSIISQMISVQKNFFDFSFEWNVNLKFLNENEKLYKIVDFSTANGDIEFHLLNSSWLSQLKEQQGKLFFPIENLLALHADKSKSPQIAVTILHHPYSWFESSNSRKLRTAIESMSDIVLTGHEHEEDFYSKNRPDGQNTEYIEGGVLQDNYSDKSQFKIITINPEVQNHRVYDFVWDKVDFLYNHEEPIDLPFVRNKRRLRSEYTLSSNLEKELSDPGANFSHSSVDTIHLEDIFVYPQVRQIRLPGDLQLIKTIVNDSMLDFVGKNKRLLLIGSEKSGKTSLAKILFRDLIKQGLIPILIKGEDFKDCSEDYVFRLIKKTYKDQYTSPEFVKYEQLNKSKRAIIIDDFNKISLNANGQDMLIRVFEDFFDAIILLGSDQLRFTDLVDPHRGKDSLVNFTVCEIMEFGRIKRADLIKRWYSLGRTFTLDENSLGQEVVKVERLVTSLIGNNLVPAFPLFILVILQQLEAKQPVDTNSGSYGYLWESLLTVSLSRGSKKDIDIDIQYNYLSELAYMFFSRNISSVSNDEIELFHDSYCLKHKLTIDKNRILENFYKVSILLDDAGLIFFRYPYLYYYFVARYLKDHMADSDMGTEIKRHIRRMSERLHNTEAANIIICLCYLSKDPYILSALLRSSKKLFSSYSECDLVNDTKFVSNLLPDVPRLILESSNLEGNHKELLSAEDETNEQPNKSVNYTSDRLDRDLQEVLQVNVAFKTIQILGQLLRNFPSLMGEQKLNLAQECYSLGLRVLKFVLTILEGNSQDMLFSLAETLKTKFPKWQYQKINQGAKSLLFTLTESVAFVTVKQVSDSIGLELLNLTYRDLLQSTQNISYKFIDLSVRLENYSSFPENNIFNLYKLVRKNQFASQLLRHIVWHYFYIYPSSLKLRNSICDRLGIQIKQTSQIPPQKLLDNKPRKFR